MESEINRASVKDRVKTKHIKSFARLGISALVIAAPILEQSFVQAGGCLLPEAPGHLRIWAEPIHMHAGSSDEPLPDHSHLFRFLWEPALGASGYEFRLDDPTTTGIINGVNKEPDVEGLLPRTGIDVDLQNPTTYNWSVSSVNECGESVEAVGPNLTIAGYTINPTVQ
ncbi:MAG: hypothetical protein HYW45_00795 [Candidatus Daviesbacteria bacterium]|nr:MAG: hypothetical protein HYW45_00795 [Candidatus Daviesbacteria bacterium]